MRRGFLVPKLGLGMPSRTLRVPPRSAQILPRSGKDGIPTQSVGTSGFALFRQKTTVKIPMDDRPSRGRVGQVVEPAARSLWRAVQHLAVLVEDLHECRIVRISPEDETLFLLLVMEDQSRGPVVVAT